MQQINEKSFRCRFYSHLTELHQTKEKNKNCSKKCQEKSEDDAPDESSEEQPKPSPEEQRIRRENQQAIKQFSRCKCSTIDKKKWRPFIERAAEILREEKCVALKDLLKQKDEQKKKGLEICVDLNDNKSSEDLQSVCDGTDMMAQLKKDRCERKKREAQERVLQQQREKCLAEKEAKCEEERKRKKECEERKKRRSACLGKDEGEDPEQSERRKSKKDCEEKKKRKSSVLAKEAEEEEVSTPAPSTPPTPSAPPPSRRSTQSTKKSTVNSKGRRKCPPKPVKKPKPKKEEEIRCSPAKDPADPNRKSSLLPDPPAPSPRSSKQGKKEKTEADASDEESSKKEEPDDYTSDEGDLWDKANDRCKKKSKNYEDLDSSDSDAECSTDEDQLKSLKPPCPPPASCPPCPEVEQACETKKFEKLMAHKSKCKWPAACRRLYEITEEDLKQPWIVQTKPKKNQKPQRIETFGACFDVAKVIPQYCRFTPKFQRQFYELKDLTDCIAKRRKFCNREVPDLLKSLRPRLWLDLVAIHRCSLGRLEIEFFAEACPFLVQKFVDVAQEGFCSRFRFTRINEGVWIEGKLDIYDVDDEGLCGGPCCPVYPENCEIISFDEGPGILSVSSRYFAAVSSYETLPFTITLCPMRILKGQRIAIGKVCNCQVLKTLSKLTTKYGCFKYDVGVKDCGITYPKDKDKPYNSNNKGTAGKSQGIC